MIGIYDRDMWTDTATARTDFQVIGPVDSLTGRQTSTQVRRFTYTADPLNTDVVDLWNTWQQWRGDVDDQDTVQAYTDSKYNAAPYWRYAQPIVEPDATWFTPEPTSFSGDFNYVRLIAGQSVTFHFPGDEALIVQPGYTAADYALGFRHYSASINQYVHVQVVFEI